jgi:hypothetical protein
VQVGVGLGKTKKMTLRRALMIVAVSAIVMYLAAGAAVRHQKWLDVADLTPQLPRNLDGVNHGLTEEELVWAVPLNRRWACIRAMAAIRYRLPHTNVDFDLDCSSAATITIDEKLIDAKVSGIAIVNGKRRPFTVELQHYPPSVSLTGFTIKSIDLQ